MKALKFTRVPVSAWPCHNDPARKEVWHHPRYLVQVFDEAGGTERISISRTNILPGGRFADDISWDELQAIKRAVGRGDCFAIEIYPSDDDIINVANMRHLWVLKNPLNIGWRCTKNL